MYARRVNPSACLDAFLLDFLLAFLLLRFPPSKTIILDDFLLDFFELFWDDFLDAFLLLQDPEP